MKAERPRGTIKDQIQTSAPPNSDSTIMDDTVVTMDSATALMGGKTVTQPAMRQSIDKIVPKVHIQRRR